MALVYRSWTPLVAAPYLRGTASRSTADARSHAGDGNATHRPPCDVYETRDAWVLRAWLPGVQPDQFDITFEKGALRLQAPLAGAPASGEDITWHRRELSEGTWQLALRLPVDLDAEQALATLENGVLTVRLPKGEHARPQSITVRASTS